MTPFTTNHSGGQPVQPQLLDLHCQRNSRTRGCAEDYATHRNIVTALLLRAADRVTLAKTLPPRSPAHEVQNRATTARQDGSQGAAGSASHPTLMVLGAGNCLDLDLPRLANQFQQIHLVDIDASALQSARERHPQIAGQLVLHAPVDVAYPLCSMGTPEAESRKTQSEGTVAEPAGLEAFAAEDRTEQPVAAQNAGTLEILRSLAAPQPANTLPQCDVVASVCLLSQLIDTLTAVIGAESAILHEGVHWLRLGHFRRMRQLCRMGSGLVLVTDLVSSDTAPQLLTVEPASLPFLTRTLLEAGNVFVGCHPDLVVRDLKSVAGAAFPDTGLDTRINVQVYPPWLWQMGPRRFVCYAVDLVDHPPT